MKMNYAQLSDLVETTKRFHTQVEADLSGNTKSVDKEAPILYDAVQSALNKEGNKIHCAAFANRVLTKALSNVHLDWAYNWVTRRLMKLSIVNETANPLASGP